MISIKSKLLRWAIHILIPARKSQHNNLKLFSKNIFNKKILEIGSGDISVDHFFDGSNIFIKSDINPSYGHKIIDVTKMNVKNEYDIIICLNVIEHIFEYKKAIKNMYNALRENGMLFLCVPCFYPLHDEPNDYWRFTEYSLKKLFSDFSHVTIKKTGLHAFPINYTVKCKK